jgi:hypothetical protein
MEPIPPFWFKQRQCRLEPAGANTYKITGPNLGEAFVRIFEVDNAWRGAVRLAADGPDADVTATAYAAQDEAWGAAFELYRNRFIV